MSRSLVLLLLAACGGVKDSASGDVPPEDSACPAGECAEDTACIPTTESCNGLDDDCDGTVDEGLLTEAFVDADGDGYGGADTTLACPDAAGTSEVGGDCDDGEPAASPGLAETCDGLDNDCDGLVDLEDPDLPAGEVVTWYHDGDLDGWAAEGAASVDGCSGDPPEGYAVRLGDCDDGDAQVYPSWGTADMDCDGTAGVGLGGAAAVWHGRTVADDAGFQIKSGDLSGDGVDDVAVTALARDSRGTVLVLDGTMGWERGARSLADAEGVLSGEAGDGATAFGGGPVLPDIDGDGVLDLGLVAGQAGDFGTFYLRTSTAASQMGSHALGDSPVSWSPSTDIGFSTVSDAGDVDGDGLSDLWLGAMFQGGSAWTGAAYLLPASENTPGDHALEDLAVRIEGTEPMDTIGVRIVSLDADQDGLPDVLTSSYVAARGGDYSGAVWYFPGTLAAAGAPFTTDDADRTWAGGPDANLGGAMRTIPDVDGDGIEELVVAAPGELRGNGRTYVLSGADVPTTRDLAASAMVVLEGGRATDIEPWGPAVAGGELDGDGRGDLLLGFPGNGEPFQWAGAVVVYLGATLAAGGTLAWEDADGLVVGSYESHQLGYAVHAADMDGDGLDDLLAGAIGDDTYAEDAGAVFVLLSPY